MVELDSVIFDTSGWDVREESESRITWSNSRGDLLSKRFAEGTPRMPSLFHPQPLFEYYYQQVQAAKGAVLAVDLLEIKGITTARCLFKTPQSQGGMGFIGTLTLAFRDFSYVIKMQMLEQPEDDARARSAWETLLSQYPEGTDVSPYWFTDPNAQSNLDCAKCWADDEAWDAHFPDHPLSRLRAELARIVPTLEYSREVKNAPPFQG